MDLTKARRNLQAESDELGILSTTLGVVYDDLEVVRSEGTSSLTAHAIEITAWVRQLERNTLRTRVNQSFVIAHSHYGTTSIWRRWAMASYLAMKSMSWRRWK